MTTRRTPSRTAAVLTAGALALSACSGFGPFGSSQVTEPADINRPDVEVDIHEGAACESIPQDVVDRHAPDAELLPLDAGRSRDAEDLAFSSCAWVSDVSPTKYSLPPPDVRAGTGIQVSLSGFDEPQRASEHYDFLYGFFVRPEGTAENGWLYGALHAVAAGDQGFMQHRRSADEPATTTAIAAFTAGDAVVEIRIVRGAADPWTGDEILAVLSDIVAAFGT